jgi:hypothetical protein
MLTNELIPFAEILPLIIALLPSCFIIALTKTVSHVSSEQRSTVTETISKNVGLDSELMQLIAL